MPYKIALAQALLVDGGIELIPWAIDENGDEMELDTLKDKLRFLRKRGFSNSKFNSKSDSPPSLQTVRALYRQERQLKQAEERKERLRIEAEEREQRIKREAEERERRLNSMVKQSIGDPEVPNLYFVPLNPMNQLSNAINNADIPILLTGKSGVGKNLLVHYVAKKLNGNILDISDKIQHLNSSENREFLEKVFEKASQIQGIILIRNVQKYSEEFMDLLNSSYDKCPSTNLVLVMTSNQDDFGVKSQKIKVPEQDAETRLKIIAALAKTYHGIFEEDEDEFYQNMANKFAGQSARFIVERMKKARHIHVDAKIKIKRSFWQKICLKPRKYVCFSPMEVLAKKVDKALI